MRTPLPGLLAAALAIAPSALRATPAPSDPACAAWAAVVKPRSAPALLFDHQRGLGFVWAEGRCAPLENGGEVRVKEKLPLYVVGTYTPLYTYSAATEKVEAAELKDLRTFGKAVGPYFAELLHGIAGPARSMAALPVGGKANPLEADLDRIHGLVAYGLAAPATRLEAFLEATRDVEPSLSDADAGETKAGRIRAIAAALEASSSVLEEDLVGEGARRPVPPGRCESIASGRVRAPGEKLPPDEDPRPFGVYAGDQDASLLTIPCLLAAYTDLGKKLRSVSPVPSEVQKVLDAREKTLKAAYDLEAIGQRVRSAEIVFEGLPSVPVTLLAGRSVTLKVSPAAAEELGRVAARGPREFKLTARPDWLVRPSVALSFLAAPEATYPKYGTAKAGDAVKVVESGTQDSRFTWGLTLGFTWRPFDGRDGAGVAWWLPELTVNPSADLKAVGVGTAASYGILKLGVGALWTKHTSLDGQSVDQLLPDASNLKTQDGYGPPKLYVALSVYGWPPFEP